MHKLLLYFEDRFIWVVQGFGRGLSLVAIQTRTACIKGIAVENRSGSDVEGLDYRVTKAGMDHCCQIIAWDGGKHWSVVISRILLASQGCEGTEMFGGQELTPTKAAKWGIVLTLSGS